jgi:phosphoribosylamine--glycine ligase
MRILFISNDLIAGNIARILKNCGHDVKIFIEEKDRRRNFKEILNKTSDWRIELNWVGKNGLIIFDDIGYGHDQDRLRKDGFSVFGGSLYGDLLEQDRVLAQNIFKEYGLKSIPSYNFNSIKKAIQFIKKNPKAWVIKQNGTSSKGINFVGNLKDGSDVIDVLRSYDRNNAIKTDTITLQEKIVGVEIAATRYFNGINWIGPTLINIEHKKLFPGDIGPTTSEMGTLGWYEQKDSKLTDLTLNKIKPYLQKINYRGVFDINCIVNKNGCYPLEATSRFGSPIVHLQTELNSSSWFEILNSTARGIDFNLKYKKNFGVVVLVAIPPFPFAKKIEDQSQIGTYLHFNSAISDKEFNRIHLEEISFDKKKKKYYISDDRGYLIYVTGTGNKIELARNSTYKLIDKIHIPKMFYRNDIGLKFLNDSIFKLRKWGYFK